MIKFIVTVALVMTTPTLAAGACNTDGSYLAASGHEVKSPRCEGAESAGATYLCRDGSYSHAENRRGACSRHGGVAKEL